MAKANNQNEDQLMKKHGKIPEQVFPACPRTGGHQSPEGGFRSTDCSHTRSPVVCTCQGGRQGAGLPCRGNLDDGVTEGHMVHLDPLDPGHLLGQTMVYEPGRTLRSSDPDPLEVLLIHQSGRVQTAGPRSGDFDSLRESQQEVVNKLYSNTKC